MESIMEQDPNQSHTLTVHDKWTIIQSKRSRRNNAVTSSTGMKALAHDKTTTSRTTGAGTDRSRPPSQRSTGSVSKTAQSGLNQRASFGI